jgi:hypothetical protein
MIDTLLKSFSSCPKDDNQNSLRNVLDEKYAEERRKKKDAKELKLVEEDRKCCERNEEECERRQTVV